LQHFTVFYFMSNTRRICFYNEEYKLILGSISFVPCSL
jgi:hypothetical protein